MKYTHEEFKKVTVNLMAKPLNYLLNETNEGITELINRLIEEEKIVEPGKL